MDIVKYSNKTPISLIEGLSVRTMNVLKERGISNFKEIMLTPKSDFMRFRNAGIASYNELHSFQEKYKENFIYNCKLEDCKLVSVKLNISCDGYSNSLFVPVNFAIVPRKGDSITIF